MYFLCSPAGHYVTSHRGENLRAGSMCPSGNCKGRLAPAPESPPERCRRCRRGLITHSADVGLHCSFCAALMNPAEAL